MDEAALNILIDKLANNTISLAELHLLMETISQQPVDDPVMDRALKRIQNLPVYKHLLDRERAAQTYVQILRDKRFTQKDGAKSRTWLLAASTVALLFLAFMVFQFYSTHLKLRDEPVFAQKIWQVPLGQRQQITLPDRTKVWLNAGSRLKILSDYADSNRLVILHGEAFFDVQKNEDKPFIVKTDALRTQVLGTSFNVNTFDPEKIQITVQEGKVAVRDQQESLSILTKNQQLLYNPKTKARQLLVIQAADATDWTQNRLKFKNVRLGDAANTLHRWSNKTFVFGNEAIKDCRFSVSFHAGESLEEVLQVISALNNFQYEVTKDTVYLVGNSCE